MLVHDTISLLKLFHSLIVQGKKEFKNCEE